MTKLFTWLTVFATLATANGQSAPVLASRVQQPSVSAAGGSFLPQFSDDGRYMVFVSQANNLVTNGETSFSLNVYRRDLAASNTLLVSVAATGAGGANADANGTTVSSNGQFIAFASRAGNLTAGDYNAAQDIFVRDVTGNKTVLASVGLNGQSPADPGRGRNVPLSDFPLISADGQFVTFESRATNLVATVIPEATVQIYRRDLSSNATELVSIGIDASASAESVKLLAMSRSGRIIAFTAANPEPGVESELYVRDLASGALHTASGAVNSITNLGSYRCTSAVIGEGTTWFVAASASGGGLFAFQHATQQLRLLRPSAAGSVVISASDDAQYILYHEAGRGSIRADASTGAGIDLGSAPCGCDSLSGTNCAYLPQMSANGRYVSFLVPTTCEMSSILWRDLDSAITTTIASTAIHEAPALSRSGLLVAFASPFPNTVPGDLNVANDIFLHDAAGNATDLVTAAHATGVAQTSPRPSGGVPLSISDDGRYVAFTRFDDPSVFRDTNRLGDAFLTDLETGAVRPLTIDTNLYESNTGGPPFYATNANAVVGALISGDGSRVIALAHTFFPNLSLLLCKSGGATERLRGASGELSPLDTVLSVDGNSVVYFTRSSVIQGDFNNVNDVYLTRLGLPGGLTNYLVSSTPTGGFAAAESLNPTLSRNARWVVFATRARSVLPGEIGAFAEPQLVAADLGTDASAPGFGYNPPKRFISHDNSGATPTGVTNAVISADSRYVVFALTNMSAIYRHDLLSSNAANVLVATNGRNPSVNADGTVVAFERVRVDGTVDIVVADAGGADEMVSRGLQGAAANGSSTGPVISGDGRYVVFQSQASNLVSGDANNHTDVFVRDRVLGVTFLLSATKRGTSGNGPSTGHKLAADGRTVVFRSFAGELALGDYNQTRDIYVAKLGSSDSDADGMDDDWEIVHFSSLSRNGDGDYDGDGVSDRNEFLTGTDPTNTGSVFRVLTLTRVGEGSRLIMWNGVPSQDYRVEYRPDLGDGAWSVLQASVTWNGSTASVTDDTAPGEKRFYRVVRLP